MAYNYTIPTPAYREAFSKVLPFESIFNQNLVTGLAESQINPEIERQRYREAQQLNAMLAEGGLYRSGRGVQAQNELANALERSRKEQVQAFTGNIYDYGTDYYNQLSNQYYQNPSGFVTPSTMTMENYMQTNPLLANAYKQQTNIPTTYKNPLLF